MKKRLTSILMAISFFIVQPTSVFADAFNTSYLKPELTSKLQAFQDEFGTTVNGLMAFFMASSVLIFIIHFIRLGQHGANPMARMKIMQDILITGVCTAIIGSLWLVYGLVVTISLS